MSRLTDLVKKFIVGLFEKWIIGLAIALTLMLGSAALGTVKVFISVPEELEQMRSERKRDSTFASNYMLQAEKRMSEMELRISLHDSQVANIQKFNERIKSKPKPR